MILLRVVVKSPKYFTLRPRSSKHASKVDLGSVLDGNFADFGVISLAKIKQQFYSTDIGLIISIDYIV
jgi:hypothetical protein